MRRKLNFFEQPIDRSLVKSLGEGASSIKVIVGVGVRPRRIDWIQFEIRRTADHFIAHVDVITHESDRKCAVATANKSIDSFNRPRYLYRIHWRTFIIVFIVVCAIAYRREWLFTLYIIKRILFAHFISSKLPFIHCYSSVWVVQINHATNRKFQILSLIYRNKVYQSFRSLYLKNSNQN